MPGLQHWTLSPCNIVLGQYLPVIYFNTRHSTPLHIYPWFLRALLSWQSLGIGEELISFSLRIILAYTGCLKCQVIWHGYFVTIGKHWASFFSQITVCIWKTRSITSYLGRCLQCRHHVSTSGWKSSNLVLILPRTDKHYAVLSELPHNTDWTFSATSQLPPLNHLLLAAADGHASPTCHTGQQHMLFFSLPLSQTRERRICWFYVNEICDMKL